MLVGSTITGKILDREYRVVKEKIQKDGIDVSNFDFPIEYARLRTMPIHLIVFCSSVFAWGWCLEKNVSIAAPLVFQILRESATRGYQDSKLIPDSWLHINLNLEYDNGKPSFSHSRIVSSLSLVECPTKSKFLRVDTHDRHSPLKWIFDHCLRKFSLAA